VLLTFRIELNEAILDVDFFFLVIKEELVFAMQAV